MSGYEGRAMTPMISEPAYFPAQSTYAGAAQSPKVSHRLASAKRSKIVEAYWHLSKAFVGVYSAPHFMFRLERSK